MVWAKRKVIELLVWRGAAQKQCGRFAEFPKGFKVPLSSSRARNYSKQSF